MHQLIGSIRDRNKRSRDNFSMKGMQTRPSNSNSSLVARLDRESITIVQTDVDELLHSKTINPPLTKDEDENEENEEQPQSHAAQHASPNGMDFNTHSAISALLEIRRDSSMQPNSTMNSSSFLNKSKSLYDKVHKSMTADAQQLTSNNNKKRLSGGGKRRISATDLGSHAQKMMLNSDNETCLPSLRVFHPYSSPRMVWDLCIIFMILYTAIAVPLRLSWSMQETLSFWILNRLLDFLFIVDITINFNTAFERGTELIIDRRSIVKHYFSTWFTLDFVASFPFDFVMSLINGGTESSISLLPRLVRLFKLSRLFRLARLQRILRRVQLQLGIRNSTNKILKFSGAAVLCAHWMACCFYAVSTVSGNSELGSFPSWVDRLAASGKNQLDSSSVSHTYIAALYWSLTTMTSIGYGDVAPKTPSERIFGIFGMICGAVLFGHFMGNVLAVVADMSPAENEFHLKMDMLSQYMKEQNLPAELRRQIEEFYHIEHKLNNYQVDEAEMLRELPDRLKRELSLAISRRILGNVPLFDGMSSSFVRTVGLSMERRVYPQGEYVIREGQEVTQFYILTAGRAYLMQDDMVLGAICHGDYFGSIPIHWKQFEQNTKSTYSVRTLEWTEVRSLSIARFRQLIVEFPDAKDILVQRIVDNILEQNEQQMSSSAAASPNRKYEIHSDAVDIESMDTTMTSNIPTRRASLSADIDRDQLVRFVQNAFNPQNTKNDLNDTVSHRRSSLIPELKETFAASSILKDLRAFKIESNKSHTKEAVMKRNISKELHHFDGLVALLSLMIDIKQADGAVADEKEKQELLLHYIQCIQDRALLAKLTKLRKVIEYAFIADADAYIDADGDADTIERHMNSFFRAFIFIEPAEKLKLMTQNWFQSSNHRRQSTTKHNETNTIELTNRLLYHGTNIEYHESLELMFFKLGYKPTFSTNSNNLDTCIAQDFFDILIIDNDDIVEIEETLQLISKAKVQSAINLVFLVSNHLDYHKIRKISNTYAVHIILRKPILYQDLYRMFEEIGLLMFA
eukprot:169591_1